MSNYINRDKLISQFQKEIDNCQSTANDKTIKGMLLGLRTAIEFARMQPAEPVVEVIYCGECEFRMLGANGRFFCAREKKILHAGDYCNYGKVKENVNAKR